MWPEPLRCAFMSAGITREMRGEGVKRQITFTLNPARLPHRGLRMEHLLWKAEHLSTDLAVLAERFSVIVIRDTRGLTAERNADGWAAARGLPLPGSLLTLCLLVSTGYQSCQWMVELKGNCVASRVITWGRRWNLWQFFSHMKSIERHYK